MQYSHHAETGEVMVNQAQLERGLQRASIKRWAYAWHDQDQFDAADVEYQRSKGRQVEVGDLKPRHVHVVLQCDDNYTIRQISNWLMIPSARVKIPSEEGEYRGNGAREKAFFDFGEYLTHEGRKQASKHQYDRSIVIANFDFSSELDQHLASRRKGVRGGSSATRKRDEVRMRIMRGEVSLKWVRENEPEVYVSDLTHLQKLRQDWRLHQPAPRHRTSYFMGSKACELRKGRTGKTTLAKLFARSLFRDLDADECYHVATDPRAPLQNYRGQPVIIWDDYNALDLMEALGGRSSVWQVFDDHPSASDVNIKYGTTRLVHTVNIITKTTPYAEFLDGLAGEYTDKSGKRHHAEDRNQSWGRFPVVFEVTVDSIEMLLNRGFVSDTDDFLAYQTVARMKASMRKISSAIDSIEDAAEREAATHQIGDVLLRPLLEQHGKLRANPARGRAEVVGELLASIEMLDPEQAAAADRAAELQREIELLEEQKRELADSARRAARCSCGSGCPEGSDIHHATDCIVVSDETRIERGRAVALSTGRPQ
ncbi:hypothetical protein [Microbacterium sp. K2]|uniref:hypothetical protein n=1 Tax=Microbacterium sp. K2 TaxID=3391827 RepID=UPI003ED9090D